MNLHFLEDILEMSFDGELADKEFFGEVLIGGALAKKLHAVHFPSGEVEPCLKVLCIDHPLGAFRLDDQMGLEAKRPFSQREADRFGQFRGIVFRFLKIIEGLSSKRLDGRLHRGVAGEHDHDRIGIDPLRLLQNLDAVNFRKMNIQNQDASLEETLMKGVDRFLPVPGDVNRIGNPLFLESYPDDFDVGGVVLYQQDGNRFFVRIQKRPLMKEGKIKGKKVDN